jgi:hypothetical protein
MKELLEIIQLIITSKETTTILALLWAFWEIRSHGEDKKRHFEERKEWAERFEKFTDTLHNLIHEIDKDKLYYMQQNKKYYSKDES